MDRDERGENPKYLSFYLNNVKISLTPTQSFTLYCQTGNSKEMSLKGAFGME
jgi:hypothetical protein